MAPSASADAANRDGAGGPVEPGVTAAPATTPAEARLAERLQDPQVLGALTTLLDHADLLAVLVEGMDQFISRSEVIGNSLLAGIQELRDVAQPDPDSARPGLAEIAGAGASLASVLPQAAPRLVAAVETGSLDKLLDTAEVSAEAMDQMQMLARALIAGSKRFEHQPVEVSGPVSMVKALRDPDVSRAISFFITIAKSVGQELAGQTPQRFS